MQDEYLDGIVTRNEISKMDKVHATGKAFFETLAAWDGEELQGSIITDLIAAHCTAESKAQLVFQMLTNGHLVEAGGFADFTPEGKMFAIQLAETMGPDWAQVLYHFSKLVTKLA